jgi:hypothetical protein
MRRPGWPVVASAGVDASFALNLEWEWDIAAEALLIRAGGASGHLEASSGSGLLEAKE